ncbi:MAG: hypothetical protein O2821_06950 [Chloroflexi bacterium]|nr:hypothetical protein [Chloroflexota bacterium]MDA1228799.1 hypothetical protein [Chloroflexota bacterium]
MTTTSFLPRMIALLERHRQDLCSSFYTRDDLTPTNHCLLGWMAEDARVALPPARYNTHVIGMKGTGRFSADLQEEYGLTLQQLQQLQLANDDARTMQEMTEMLIRLARGWHVGFDLAA